jgi:cholesterol oxidase
MDFDAIVIGTGFGGTIAATRLAAKGKKTLMLERGTWLRSGTIGSL